MVKFFLVFLFATVLFALFDISTISNVTNSTLVNLSSGNLFNGLKSIFTNIGQIFDTVLFNSETVLVTSGGIELGSVVWLSMICRVLLVLFLFKLLIKVVLWNKYLNHLVCVV